MTRRLLNLLTAGSLLLYAAAGCASQASVRAKELSIRPGPWQDGGMSLDFDVPDVAALWQTGADEPLLLLDVGPGRVERLRRGDTFLVFARGDRVRVDAPAEPLGSQLLATPPEDDLDAAVMATFEIPMVVAEAVGTLPEALAKRLDDPNDAIRDAAADWLRYLLRTERVPMSGSLGPRGRIGGWINLPAADRQRLEESLARAAPCRATTAPAASDPHP